MDSSTILLLEDSVINQIAAGEVVERPANVVKELLENAIDAGATRIRVELRDGGRHSIAVIDNGYGMSRSDAALCVRRHATSKIKKIEDLQHLRTLGFRGEALASIAAVSRFRLRTMPSNAQEGVEIRVDGGGPAQIQTAACAPGTRVDVEDLFYSVPVRRKFLKARQTELGHILEHCLREALLRPSLLLQVVHDGRMVREFLPVSGVAERVNQTFRDLQMEHIEFERGSLRGEAWLSSPSDARRGSKQLLLYVNDRPVDDYRLARAIALSYGDALAPGSYPVGVLQLWLDPSQVDCNVHPQKTEVRFARAFEVCDALSKALGRKLSFSLGANEAINPFWQRALERDSAAANVARSFVESHVAETSTKYSATPETYVQISRSLDDLNWRVLAQSHGLYLICENARGIYLIDQHAASERVLAARISLDQQKGTLQEQHLLFPERIALEERDMQIVDSQQEQLKAFGFDVAMMGRAEVAIRSVPALLTQASASILLRDFLNAHSERSTETSAARSQHLAGVFACRAALRRGHILTQEEAQRLVGELQAIEGKEIFCPHSHAVAHCWTLDHLERSLSK